MLEIPFGDVYLHNPGRLRYVAVLALPFLAAAGLQGWRNDRCPARRRSRWLGVAAPRSSSGRSRRVAPRSVRDVRRDLLVAAPLLFGFATRRWRWASATALVGLLSMELLASAVYAQAYEGGTVFTGLETGEHPALVPQVLRFPELSEADYLAPTPIVDHLRRTRAASRRGRRPPPSSRRATCG